MGGVSAGERLLVLDLLAGRLVPHSQRVKSDIFQCRFLPDAGGSSIICGARNGQISLADLRSK